MTRRPTLACFFACLLLLSACTSGQDADQDAGGPNGGSAGNAGDSAGSSGRAGTAGEPRAGDGSEPDGSVLEGEQPECVDGVLQLAGSFHLQREVDYLADRRGDRVLSEVGTPCARARDPELCQAAIAASTLVGVRHLLTTEGDKILQWDGSSAVSLLGAIDTLGEALWMSEAFDYGVDCDTEVTFAEDLFIVRDAYAHWGCAEPQAIVTIVITPEGGVSEVRSQPLNTNMCSPREIVGAMMMF